MKAQPTPLTHKLILVVLGLILACLVMLVVQAFRPDSARIEEGNQQGAQSDLAEDGTVAVSRMVAPRWNTNAMKRSIPTNRLAFEPARVRAPGEETTGGEPDAAAVESVVAKEPTVVSERILAVGASIAAPGVVTNPHGASAGVFGRVTLSGVPKPEVPIDLGPTCGPHQTGPATTRHYVVSQDGGLANVLIVAYRSSGSESTLDTALREGEEMGTSSLKTPVVLDQKGCMFEPYVTAIQTSQTLIVRNSDPVLHNLHFTPKLNRERNVAQFRQGQEDRFRFEIPETFIRLKCDVHSWMFAYVSVLPHSFFAVTDTNGHYRIRSGLPPGNYRLAGIHLKEGTFNQAFTAVASAETQIDFQFTVNDLPRQASTARH